MMMHLSDSGGLAEGDFDYEPDSSFLLKVEKNSKTLSDTDYAKYFIKKKKKSLSSLVGSVEKLLELRRYGEQHWCWCQCMSSFGNGECFVSLSLGTQGFLA